MRKIALDIGALSVEEYALIVEALNLYATTQQTMKAELAWKLSRELFSKFIAILDTKK